MQKLVSNTHVLQQKQSQTGCKRAAIWASAVKSAFLDPTDYQTELCQLASSSLEFKTKHLELKANFRLCTLKTDSDREHAEFNTI